MKNIFISGGRGMLGFALIKELTDQSNLILSPGSDILNLTNKYNNLLNIKYFKNDKIGMSKNTNFAIEKCCGSFIKILYQDDFLYSRHSLSDIAKETANDFDWLVTACEHSNDGETFYRSFYPKYNDDIHLGNNTISSPSVLTIKNSDDKLFFMKMLLGLWM